MFPKQKAADYESKELELTLKENESSRKIKKKHVGKATIELAKYATGCGESEFSTHFLKFDLVEDKSVCAKVTATLKIRRDPTGELYGTSRLSTASHSSVGRYSDESDDDDFKASDDDEEQISGAAAAANDAHTNDKASSAGDDAPDADASKSESDPKRKKKSKLSASTSKHPEGEAPRRVQDKELAMFTPPPRLRRTVSSGQHDPLAARRQPDIVLDADDGSKTPVSPRTAAMSLVSISKLALTRRASVDGRALRVHVSADDVGDGDASDVAGDAGDAGDVVDRVVLRASESIAISDSSHSTPQRSLSRQASGSPPEQLSPSRRRSELTRMESLRADNLRKYGQRRRNDGEAQEVVATVSTSPRGLNSPPTLKNTVSDGNLMVGAPTNLLREKDAELERLKSQLALQQREEDRRFFVEEAIVFMEPAYADDGLPVGAYVIFRTLVHWDVFDGSNARFVVSVLDAFEKVLKRNVQNREVLLYGLATCAALQHLLRTELGGGGGALDGAQRNTGNSSCGASDVDPDGSVASSPVNHRNGAGGVPPLRAFIEQLGDVAHAFFLRSIELLLSQTDTLLVPAILEGDMANPERNAAPKARLLQVLKDWHNDATQVHHLHASIVEQLFYAVFDELGVRLFNALLERRDLCSCGNGLQTKMNVSAIEQWANSVRMNVKPALAPIMQAADVLAMNKTALLDAATRADVCPELNPTQLHRLLTLYAPDDYDPEAVHPGVLKQLASLASDATRPLHRRAQVRRCDARLGRRRFDLGLAALRTPRSLLQRPGFAFLGASAVAAAAAVASSAADADEPW